MQPQVVPDLQSAPPRQLLSAPVLWICWLVAGAALLGGIGSPPVQRTQEARVLETAREMLGSGWHGWMVPKLNGQLRVRKPPLTYWMTAAMYRIGGVGEGPGRVPAALLGWVTVAVTFFCGQWLFGHRAGFFGAGCLLCSYLLFRYTRLAETDAPAMCFVTIAIFAWWRAVEEDGTHGDAEKRGRGETEGMQGLKLPFSLSPGILTYASQRPLPSRVPASSARWFHVGAAATALAILCKGPPGAYPPLFLVVLVIARRDGEALVRFLRSGALFTLLVIASPWFVYIKHAVGLDQWKREFDELGGEDHPGHFWQYLYELFIATAPWCLLMPPALIAAIRLRHDRRIMGLLIWIAIILVPLCVVGNKQFHYLLPLMPPVMLLIGWWIDRVLAARGPAPLLEATWIGSGLAIPGVLIGTRITLGRIGPLDLALAALIAAALANVWLVYLRRGPYPGMMAYLAALLLVFVPAVSIWMPRMERENSRDVARQIQSRFGPGPYCFYGPNYSLPLCYNLRTTIPQVRSAGELELLSSREPRLVVIAQTKSRWAPPPVPVEFEQQAPPIVAPGQLFQVYRLRAK